MNEGDGMLWTTASSCNLICGRSRSMRGEEGWIEKVF